MKTTTLKNIISVTLIIDVFTTLAFSQNLTQKVSGTIIDIDRRLQLIGTTILIVGTNLSIVTITDTDGNLRFEKLSIGQIALQTSYLDYPGKKNIPNLM
jgi:hypothetical protein